MKKRFLSILIALCLATQFVPTTALAAQAEAVGNTPAAADVVAESDLGADQDAVLGEDQDTEAEQADVDPQANDSAIAAVSETGDLASEPALTSVTDAHIHPICGDSDCTDDSHHQDKWIAWNSSTSLPSDSGMYYLTTDVALSETWTCGYNTVLCLNGKTITGRSYNDAIKVQSRISLTITDCHDGEAVGKIIHVGGHLCGGRPRYLQ